MRRSIVLVHGLARFSFLKRPAIPEEDVPEGCGEQEADSTGCEPHELVVHLVPLVPGEPDEHLEYADNIVES